MQSNQDQTRAATGAHQQRSLLDTKPKRSRNTPLTDEQYRIAAERVRKILASGLKPYDDELLVILNRSLNFKLSEAQMKKARELAGCNSFVARRSFEETLAVEKACGRDPLAQYSGARVAQLEGRLRDQAARIAQMSTAMQQAAKLLLGQAAS